MSFNALRLGPCHKPRHNFLIRRGVEFGPGLRWQDVDLLNDTLTIRKGKTAAAARVIPLTPDAFEVLVQLRKRAELFGEVRPEHYVFARFKPVGRFHGKEIVEHRMLSFDPTTPLGSWKKAWSKLTAEAGLPGLRFHDLRHHALTVLYENPNASEQTIRAIAGQISQRMTERYSHSRMEAKRKALAALTSHPETLVTPVTPQCFIDDRGNSSADPVTGTVTAPAIGSQ